MGDKAEYYNRQGLRLVCTGQLQEAIEFFTKAIELDPQFSDAYRNRGGVLLQMDRIIEANADIQKAKDLRSGKSRGKVNGKSTGKKNGQRVRLNWREIDNVYDAVFPIDCQDSEIVKPFRLDWREVDSIYDSVECDDSFDSNVFLNAAEGREGVREAAARYATEINNYPASLELINGKCLEVERVRLFEPTNNDLTIIRQDGHVERVISLKHIACISKEEIPAKRNKNKKSLRHVEIIETVDGKIYYVVVHPEQNYENVLSGYSAKERDRSVCKFIPVVNIRRRCLDRYFGEILLEKGFIDNDVLKQALEEYQQTKSMKLGKIIARKTKIPYANIESELKRARQVKAQAGIKTGKILIAAGLVSEEQVLDALEYQKHLQKIKIGQFLVEKGVVQEKDVSIALAEKFRIPFVDLSKQKVSGNTLKLLSKNFIQQNEILPISFDKDILTVAVLQPDVACLREEIINQSNCKEVRFVLALPSHLRTIIGLLDNMIGCV